MRDVAELSDGEVKEALGACLTALGVTSPGIRAYWMGTTDWAHRPDVPSSAQRRACLRELINNRTEFDEQIALAAEGLELCVKSPT